MESTGLSGESGEVRGRFGGYCQESEGEAKVECKQSGSILRGGEEEVSDIGSVSGSCEDTNKSS